MLKIVASASASADRSAIAVAQAIRSTGIRILGRVCANTIDFGSEIRALRVSAGRDRPVPHLDRCDRWGRLGVGSGVDDRDRARQLAANAKVAANLKHQACQFRGLDQMQGCTPAQRCSLWQSRSESMGNPRGVWPFRGRVKTPGRLFQSARASPISAAFGRRSSLAHRDHSRINASIPRFERPATGRFPVIARRENLEQLRRNSGRAGGPRLPSTEFALGIVAAKDR